MRVIIVSLFSFFPGFLFSLLASFLYASVRHPNDSQAPLRGIPVAVGAGLACMLTVGFLQVKTKRSA